MPLNTLRLNHQKSSHPNDRIVFIKPLPRPAAQRADYDLADTFLRAIAAQCLPVMKGHHLSVTTLEEHEPNREFIGRNFNNGEVIQLVLRGQDGRRWNPFEMVAMVMMHELAHNTHMNHGKAFWETRNTYAEQLKGLWTKGYTGEGFWGSGRTLDDMRTTMGDNGVLTSRELQDLPLCGGAYRSRRRRRKRRAKGGPDDGRELTWKEKKERRIEKKFGKNGVTLGEDEDKRLGLEINRKGPVGGKPRVAQSKRGRELRAAAALARFEKNKQEVAALNGPEDADDGESTEEDEEDYEDVDVPEGEDAKDVNGMTILDHQGNGMVRVCEEEDKDDENVKHELRELEGLDYSFRTRLQQQEQRDVDVGPSAVTLSAHAEHNSLDRDSPVEDGRGDDDDDDDKKTTSNPLPRTGSAVEEERSSRIPSTKKTTSGMSVVSTTLPPLPTTTVIPCPICSLENPRANATCMACAHVLDPKKDPRHWSCQSEVCKGEGGNRYLNGGDAGVCGICGVRREALRGDL
ncbi:hypothetical protein H2204_002603 [Knufia peltigerae]|uniref:WLM domain-containing protein n=1 Tax=Knufia peltigerae TaxID=1002370 RepID=A0AA38YB27_9EURO|nr:hypothetical protein H2204_002603 [Knufia peltigerae]